MMNLEGEEFVGASIEAVWEAINNPDVLKKCIPGCESLDKTSPLEMDAIVTIKVGPIKARFLGSVTLSELNPPFSCAITGEGKGGVAGFAKGGAQVELKSSGADSTILLYRVNADVAGKLAQLGSRLIISTSQKLAREFFANFNREVSIQNVAH